MKKYENLLSRIAEAGFEVSSDLITVIRISDNWAVEIYKNNDNTDFEVEIFNTRISRLVERLYNIPDVAELELCLEWLIRVYLLPKNQDHNNIILWNGEQDYMEVKEDLRPVLEDSPYPPYFI